METGANEVYVIDSDEHGEVLVPAIRQCILDVDVEKKDDEDPSAGRISIRGVEDDEFSYTYFISGDGDEWSEYKHYRTRRQCRAFVY